jgi:diazepam-binding inhibitor (GABA receptor modulator, acyl-CoA-binding protein)
MADIKAQFEAAAAASKQLPERPDNATLLKMYALFKQGSVGDVQDERPGLVDFVARAKYDAWAKLTGTKQEDAMKQYVELVESLKD